MIGDEISLASSITQNDSIAQEESERFSKHHPFINLLLMSVGPFLTTIGLAVLDSIDLMIISQRFKDDPNSYAVQIIGIGFFVLQICLDIGIFMSQAVLVRLSSLIGEGRRESACQLFVDVIRISIIVNILATIIITFCARPLMNFAGCTPDLIEQCMLLVISTIAGLPIYTLFHVTTAFLQSIGKAVLNGLVHLAANVIQTFILTPILQYYIKIDVTLSNISQPIAQSFVGLILFIMIFRGKFSLKPTFEMWFRPFNPETKIAFKLSLPAIPGFIYGLLPSSLILRFMTSASSSESLKTDVIGVYTVIQKILLIGLALVLAISMGFLTIATHSIASLNYKRMLMTLVYSLIITVAFLLIFIPLMLANPLSIVKLFISSESQLELAKKMVPIPIYTLVLSNIYMFTNTFFVAVGKPFISLALSFIQLISICVGAKVLNIKYPKDPTKQMFSYNICDILTFTFSIIMFIIEVIPYIQKVRHSNESTNQATKSLVRSSNIEHVLQSQY